MMISNYFDSRSASAWEKKDYLLRGTFSSNFVSNLSTIHRQILFRWFASAESCAFGVMGQKSVAVLLLLSLFCKVSADEILGCGGFIKTDVEINFSLIEVKLYTKQGSLKYQTDCAPNNGYYMLPVYNKGEYVIKVEAPSGWTFEPMSYSITIDGKTDKCTLLEDINFLFTGFGVIGKVVSKGHEVGPAGVNLVLKSASGELVRTTKSVAGGSYTFQKVLPGDYIVEASHPIWKFESSTGKVSLAKETGKVTKTIVVSGFDVKGKILSDGEPVSGVNFFLFGSENVELKGCSKDSGTMQAPALEGLALLCSTISDASGRFEFSAVQSGNYVLVPFYRGEKIKYDVSPSRVDVAVQHDSFVIEDPFQVAGFVVSGKVKTSAKGQGVPGAHVFVNGSPVTKADDSGTFHLEAVKTGVYKLKAEAQRLQFDSLEVKITPNTPHLPNLVASKFEVCGRIIVNESNDNFPSGSREVTFFDGKGEKYAQVFTLEDGSFCLFAARGSYKCSAKITEEERSAGFRLLPYENVVQVIDSPVDGITFSQFHARISGSIKCLEICGIMELVLQSSNKFEEPKVLEVASDTNSIDFQFESIMAGSYELTVRNEKWCWLRKTFPMNVVDRDVDGLTFVQSGYVVDCSLTHDARLTFDPLFKHSDDLSLTFDLSRGLNKFCLKESGVYLVSIDSCHQFESESYKYDTSLGGVLSLTAVLHKVEISVTTTSEHDDITALISDQDGKTIEIGPLVLSKTSSDAKKFEYTIQHWARAGETFSVSLSSGILLFEPQMTQVTVKSDKCPSGRSLFVGRQGAFIQGEVLPALSGVNVVVSLNDGKTVETITNEKGVYRIGPIDASLKYETSISRSGYAFASIEGQPGFFKASKLAEIIVKVTDDSTGSDLPGVLLSLSGGDSFRRNTVTQENEALVLANLGPGQYFLKPMMKEYEFEPSSKFIEINEGATVQVDVVAKRVAFSCYGHVTSLNGEPEVGVYLEAVSVGGTGGQCQDHQEESKTEVDGSIRIRGLKPGCEYILRMKDDKDLNAVIERTSPKQIQLKVTNEDIHDVKFVAFRRIGTMDISGRVVASQEYLGSIKVHLLQESNLDAPQHTTSLGPSPFFYFSSIPIDNQNYLLRLTSSLSRTQFNFSLPEVQFKSDSAFKHFTLHFNPQYKVGDQELAHSSLLVLPLTLLVLYICYNRKQVLPLVSHYILMMFSVFASRVSSRSSPSQTPQPPVESIAAEFLAEVPAKKKQKAKKI